MLLLFCQLGNFLRLSWPTWLGLHSRKLGDLSRRGAYRLRRLDQLALVLGFGRFLFLWHFKVPLLAIIRWIVPDRLVFRFRLSFLRSALRLVSYNARVIAAQSQGLYGGEAD